LATINATYPVFTIFITQLRRHLTTKITVDVNKDTIT
jgi:hypothetical protein